MLSRLFFGGGGGGGVGSGDEATALVTITSCLCGKIGSCVMVEKKGFVMEIDVIELVPIQDVAALTNLIKWGASIRHSWKQW